MECFKHIIITRFNLSKRWEADKADNSVLDREWLDHRYKLFEDFCLPSLKGQTCQNFEWWVYFDESLDSDYKLKNEEFKKGFENFIPKYERSYDEFEINMPNDLKKKLVDEGVSWVITTRLDNDDVLAKNTVEMIQTKTHFNDLCLLEVPCGYTLEIKKTSIVRKVERYLNPFISLIEKVSIDTDVKGVYYQQHNKWKDVESQIVSKKPQWIQIIHDRNVINKAAGFEVSSYGLKERFNFNFNKVKFKPLYAFSLIIIKRFCKRIIKLLKNYSSKE